MIDAERVSNTSLRLKEIMRERNLKQVDILRLAQPYCEKYGEKLNRSNLSQYVRGDFEPGQHKTFILACALDVSEAWLMGYDVPMAREPKKKPDPFKFIVGADRIAEAMHNISKAEPPNTGEPTNREQRRKAEKMRREENKASYGNLQIMPNDSVYMIPVFESVSAGFGAYACSDVTEYFPMYIENPADAADMLCIKVKGDSMYPKIEEGDIVAVRKQSSVDSGSLAVMLIDGEEGVVKKVNYGPDWIELISINPMYPPRRFEGSEVQRLQVVGLVKKVIKSV